MTETEFQELLFERWIKRTEELAKWLHTATAISDVEYDGIPLKAYSLIPLGCFGYAKFDVDKKLVAYRLGYNCWHRSPEYEGPI